MTTLQYLPRWRLLLYYGDKRECECSRIRFEIHTSQKSLTIPTYKLKIDPGEKKEYKLNSNSPPPRNNRCWFAQTYL